MSRIVKKVLAAEEDLLLGKGSIQQVRGDKPYFVNKLRFLKPVDSVEDISTVNTGNFIDLYLQELYPDSGIDGGFFKWNATELKSTHDGIDTLSPTVPWTTEAEYKTGNLETAAGGSGVWERIDSFSVSTSTSRDTTDGSSWKNHGTEGMHGLGATVLTLSTADVDTHVVSGTYGVAASAANNPFTTDCSLEVVVISATQIVQTLTKLSTGDKKQRIKTGAGFQAWADVAIVSTAAWTPEVRNHPADLEATGYTVDNAYYIKVGSMVTVSCEVTLTDTSNFGATDILVLANLPFTANAASQGAWRGIATGSFITLAEQLTYCTLASTTSIQLHAAIPSGATKTLFQQDVTDTSTVVSVCLTYLTEA